MGTRADFYVGNGVNAEWLGSVAWDGYQWAEDEGCAIAKAKTEVDFRAAVKELETERNDFTKPEEGWPWPWDDSNTTDYAYCFHNGKVEMYCFGRPIGGDEDAPKKDDWPDMAKRKNVQWGAKSGVIVVGT